MIFRFWLDIIISDYKYFKQGQATLCESYLFSLNDNSWKMISDSVPVHEVSIYRTRLVSYLLIEDVIGLNI